MEMNKHNNPYQEVANDDDLDEALEEIAFACQDYDLRIGQLFEILQASKTIDDLFTIPNSQLIKLIREEIYQEEDNDENY